MDTKELVIWINKLIRYKNIKAFYKNSKWLELRAEVLDDERDECQICKVNGGYSEAVTVHHIKYVREHPELALTRSNLMSVCKECHYEIHHTIAYKEQLNEERW